MKIPVIQGVIDRRMLVNYRCEPARLSALLPEPFRPKLIGDWGMAGICLIRLRQMRPRGLPRFVGVGSENAAHRIAVEWNDPTDGRLREGVYIPRRDTSSTLNTRVGGRLFPGVYYHARFDVDETADGRLHVAFASDDGVTRVNVDATLADSLQAGSVFKSVRQASDFFRGGAVGYSFAGDGSPLDGMELKTQTWEVTPLNVTTVASSFFDDATRFPRGSATFDNALLMRNIEHEWHATAAP